MSTTTTATEIKTETAKVDPPKKVSVSKETRDRVLGTRITPEIAAENAKKKVDEEKRLADEKAAADKKKLDDEKAAEDAKTKEKKKLTAPPLPEAPTLPAPAVTNQSIEDTVRKILPELNAGKAPMPILTPDIEREIELAKFAERTGGERFAGFSQKVIDFHVAKDQLIAEKEKELGGRTAEFREYFEGEAFKTWADQHRPSYAGNKRKFEEDMVAERARQDAQRAIKPQLDEINRKTLELEHMPVIKKLTEHAVHTIILLTPEGETEKDPALEGFAKNPSEFGAEHPEEARIIASQAAETLELFQACHRVDRGIDVVDNKNPIQAELSKFMVNADADLRRKFPNGVPMNDGKILVDQDTYQKHKLASNPQYRTFNAHDIATAIAIEGRRKILEKLKQRREGVAKSIYSKPVAPVAPAKVEPPKLPPTASPEATTSRAPNTPNKANEKKGLGARYA